MVVGRFTCKAMPQFLGPGVLTAESLSILFALNYTASVSVIGI